MTPFGGLLLAAALGCGHKGEPKQDAPPVSSAAALPSASASSAEQKPRAPQKLVRREGQALMRSPTEPALYLADEDHSLLRRIALTPELTAPPPFPSGPDGGAPDFDHTPPPVHFGDATEARVELPGRPAQVFVTGDRVLVTVRDPGMLLVFSSGEAPKEIGRVSLPADAWGIALSPDASSAYVTSAWTHKLTKVDLASTRVAWTIDVAREPRGLTVTADGKTVFVSHLMGAELTRVDVTSDPKLDRVSLPPDPLRTFAGDKTVTASLGYAAILAPDGRRLYAARQALGALWSWQGNGTVDVLSTVTGEPVAAKREGKPYGDLSTDEMKMGPRWADHAGAIAIEAGSFVQPRAMVYREKTHHLLVATEGEARLVELDAMSTSPGVVVNRFYRLGGLTPKDPTKIRIPPHCGAPTGVALSADEDVAWAYCRATDNIVAVRLTPDGIRAVSSEITYLEQAAWHDKLSPWGPFAYAKLSVPEQAEPLALGRRLFYDAEEPVVSGTMACAGCHPDGRDDGHVWREQGEKESSRFIAGPSLVHDGFHETEASYGFARQTPMLAGRVDAAGPYGWHAESPTLEARIRAGFLIHRAGWFEPPDGKTMHLRAEPLIEFLRKGLVPPPREERELTDDERKGKSVFESPKTQCATCHVPKSGFTDRSAVALRGFKVLPLFNEDPKREYKAPSLLYVSGTPPYYHDGSVPTLEELVDHDYDRMGHTSHLSAEERASLVAYLRTL